MNNTSCNVVLDDTNKEINVSGMRELPIAVYNDDLKAQAVPYHWHDEVELIVVVSGEMTLTVELEKFSLKAGEGIFINSGRLHSCTADNDCIIKSFVLHCRFIYGEVGSVLYGSYFQPLLQETSPSTCILSGETCKLVLGAYDTFARQDFAYEFAVRELLTNILLSIIKTTEHKHVAIDRRAQRQLARCKLMMSYIHEHHGEEITLSQIADSADIKESEALRCFKNILNTSPIKYLKKYRLEQAATLLKTTTHPIIDIGIACGFTEMSYFAKSFKQMYALTPTEFRNTSHA